MNVSVTFFSVGRRQPSRWEWTTRISCYCRLSCQLRHEQIDSKYANGSKWSFKGVSYSSCIWVLSLERVPLVINMYAGHKGRIRCFHLSICSGMTLIFFPIHGWLVVLSYTSNSINCAHMPTWREATQQLKFSLSSIRNGYTIKCGAFQDSQKLDLEVVH